MKSAVSLEIDLMLSEAQREAVFAADLRYTLTGKVPEDTLKLITDTME